MSDKHGRDPVIRIAVVVFTLAVLAVPIIVAVKFPRSCL